MPGGEITTADLAVDRGDDMREIEVQFVEFKTLDTGSNARFSHLDGGTIVLELLRADRADPARAEQGLVASYLFWQDRVGPDIR